MTVGTRPVVVIGVGQLRNNRDRSPEQALEPLELMTRAVGFAVDDAGITSADLADLDAVRVVQVMSWAYDDAAAAVSESLGAHRAKAFVSDVGGHQPVAVLTQLAARISSGEAELALLCGGEAQSSVDALGAGKDPSVVPGWSHSPGGAGTFTRATGGTERMWDLGLVGPIRIYPLWENRLRHDMGQSFAASQRWSAEMYARFSELAADNDAAWNQHPVTPEEVAEVGPTNRMICFPYTLRMNALNRVDQAAAVLLASPERADTLGIPEGRRIYLQSAAIDEDCEDVLERESFSRSPGLERALDEALRLAGLAPNDLDVLDLYSCFPIVPKLGAIHLGLGRDADLSVTGGLTSFGGAHNNYSSHALVAAVRALRRQGEAGLVYANGEYLTKHAALTMRKTSTGQPFSWTMRSGAEEGRVEVDDSYLGTLEVETFTVEFDREGFPSRGYVIGRTPAGSRTGVRVSRHDNATLQRLVSEAEDPMGQFGHVAVDEGRRLFSFGQDLPA